MKPLARITIVQVLLLCMVSGSASAGDWPCWRGPAQTGMAYENAVVTDWSRDGTNVLWSAPIQGRSTPVLLDGRLFFIAPSGKDDCLQERVVCLEADTGKLLWEHRFNVYLTTIVENRIGWSAVVCDPETKYVYAHGTGGMFYCFDRDGNVVWRRSLTEMYGRVSGYGGRLHTPIIDEGRVIISFVSSNWGKHGRPGHRYVAFDKKTGDVIWWSKPGVKPLDTTYSVPFVTVVGGRRLLVAANADGNVYAMKARTGEKVWTFRLSKRGLNTSIVGVGNHVFVTHSEENLNTTKMGSVVCLDASLSGDITETGVVWRYDGITAGYSSPALADGRLYVANNAAELYCFDAKMGKVHWTHKLGRVMKGSPTVTADGVIYIGTVNGRFHILKDAGTTCESLDLETFTASDGSVVEIFGSPIVCDGRVYFMNRQKTYCLGKMDAKVKTVAIPAMAKEATPDSSGVSTILAVPGEVTVAPGNTQTFSFRFFDANGQEIEPANFRLTPLSVTYGGLAGKFRNMFGPTPLFIAGPSQTAQASDVVFATASGLKCGVRIRVSPSLPFTEGFDRLKGMAYPPGWVGVGGKSKLVDLDGNLVLQKLAVKPSVPMMRMRAYSGPPIAVEGGYTVQCDMMGQPRTKGRPVWPDMGLINSRYLLKMMGDRKTLRLVTWSPIPRLRKEVPLGWKTDIWYRAKLRVEMKDGKGLVRGKVWPRDEDEPKDWQIEMIDPCPNDEGGPGLYAYSHGTKTNKKGAPSFYDNYRVYAND